jgi:adenosylcobinamide kinase/adenosylcobinamide-phosphate guanylyltransferase
VSGLVLFTGGARSGKSRFAAGLAASKTRPVVVAVGGALVDEEMERRVARHGEERPPDWRVLEIGAEPADALEAVSEEAVLLLDCLGSIVGRVVAEAFGGVAGGRSEPDVADASVERHVEIEVSRILDTLLARDGYTVVVTNEVGEGVVPATASGRLFRDVMGRANQRLCAAADAAYLVVAGVCLDLASLSTRPGWPDEEGRA